MKPLLAIAAEYGVHVHVWDLPEGVLGLYDDEEKRIYLALRLTYAECRSTLAHELGHAFYGHNCDTERGERQARAYAARLLVEPAEYARLEKINDDHHWLAEEFSVTPKIILDYEQMCLTRLRGVTYSKARMGIGQWDHRTQTA